jgi:hypothetical protein
MFEGTMYSSGNLEATEMVSDAVSAFYWSVLLLTVSVEELGKSVSFGLLNESISSVGIAMGYGLDGRDPTPGRGKRSFCTPQRPDRLWSGLQALFPSG